jgi:hypothetical protein
MKSRIWVVTAAIAALGAFGIGCRDRATDGSEQNQPQGTGGSGQVDEPRVGDGKVGRNNGVIDDGEGPLEQDGRSEDKIGDNPGVLNDGEGPIEQHQDNP